jgi:hypothetical protein
MILKLIKIKIIIQDKKLVDNKVWDFQKKMVYIRVQSLNLLAKNKI